MTPTDGAPATDIERQTSTDDRRDRGLIAYSKIFEVVPSEVLDAFDTVVGRDFAEEALHAAGGQLWWSPALTDRDRSVAIVTALVCQGISGDRLSTHLRLARQHGMDSAALTALMIVLATYAGYAHASQGMEAVHRSTQADDPQMSGSQPLPS